MSTVDTPYVDLIYNEIKKLYGQSSNSLLHMMMPCTLLEKGNYDYPGNDTIDSQQRKPETVVDAEFRLVDDTFDLSKLVGGPRGVKVSQMYSDIINQLLPSSQEEGTTNSELTPDQDFITAWLTEEVDNWEAPVDDVLENLPDSVKGAIPPPRPAVANRPDMIPAKIQRIDLYQKLVDAYEQERFRWEQFKVLARPDFSDADKIDQFNKMLAFYAPTVDKKLEAIWAVLVVRGQYHRVRRYIGYIDVESGSEILLTAKENLRASVFRSIDDTQDVYPVYLTPANWAKYLSTAFKPEDLLSNENAISDELFDKEKERSGLLLQKNSVMANAQDISKLEKEEIAARNHFLDAQDAVMGHYADAAVQVIKLYFKAKNSKTKDPEKATGTMDELNSALKTKDQDPILKQEDFDALLANYKEGLKAESDMQKASEALSRAQLATASARGKDQSTFVAELEQKINSLGFDIDYLSKILQKSQNATGIEIKVAPGTGGDTETLPAKIPKTMPTNVNIPSQTEGASIWQEVVLDMRRSQSATTHFDQAYVSHMDWSVNLFFGSASGSESTSRSSSKDTRSQKNTDVKIAFRCMKVEIGRGWFNPALFSRSDEFCHMSSTTKIAPATFPLIEAIITNNKGPSDPIIAAANKCILPTFPTAFIVAKDVHIILKSDEAYSDEEVSDMQHSFNAGGGILCFRVSKSESSNEHRTSVSIQNGETSCSIKIPAPQVLAWISEFVPEDKSNRSYIPINRKEFETAKVSTQ